MTIGVFDSGLGGLSVANALEKALPEVKVLFRNDKENVPYGAKDPELLFKISLPILKDLQKDGCKLIVIACNTLSTTIIDDLRMELDVPLIAVEPMLEEAASLSKSGVIAVCATPTTLGSQRYRELKYQFAEDMTVVEPDCSDWSRMIEFKMIDRTNIFTRIDQACQKGADVIVLGCTHYHWIETLIMQIADERAIVLQPTAKIIGQVKRELTKS